MKRKLKNIKLLNINYKNLRSYKKIISVYLKLTSNKTLTQKAGEE